MKNKELRLKAQEYIETEKIDKNTYQVEKAFIDGAKMALQQVKNNDLLHIVVEPKDTFICKLCNEEMEVGEQCGYENMSCPNYTGK